MVTIKRYPNRKLYDTEARKYITLEKVAELIRSGNEVEVLDTASGDDLTALILTQIIYEQEKKNGGFLPRSVLQSLVQSGGETLNNLRNGLSYPLNLVSHVDDEIRRRVEILVKEGEIRLEDGQQMVKRLIQNASESFSNQSEEGRSADFFDRLKLLGVPSRSELEDLKNQIATLEQALATLTESEEDDGEV